MTGLLYLLLFQLLGELVARGLGLPLPGPVVGMMLLLMFLMVRGKPDKSLESGANFLLKHLSLLFVPAGVGVIQYLPLLIEQGPVLLGTVIVSTTVTLLLAGLLLQRLARRKEPKHGERLGPAG